jgi:hypothetical protein
MLDADGGWCPLGHTDVQVGFRPVLLALGLALDMMADQHFFICVGFPPPPSHGGGAAGAASHPGGAIDPL